MPACSTNGTTTPRPSRAAAYHAYYEFMPLFRQIDWGRLARFQVLDDRQYRSSRARYPPEPLRDH